MKHLVVPVFILIAFFVLEKHFGMKFNSYVPALTILAYVGVSFIWLVATNEARVQKQLEKEIKEFDEVTNQLDQDFDKTNPQLTIEKGLARIRKANKIPGMVAGFKRIGEPVVAGASGLRARHDEAPITVEDHLHIGSCTKAMTATMIARLVERKILTWETTIAEGLPELSKKIHADYHDSTLKQLLQHRSRISRTPSWHKFSGKDDLPNVRRKLVEASLADPPKLKPNEYEYSNLGYVVAALIANKATGKSWEQLMREEIFEPLDLKSAGFGPPGIEGKVDQPWGHIVSLGILSGVQADNVPALGPAGTVHLSIADWGKFLEQHLPAKPEKKLEGANGEDKDSASAKKMATRLLSNESLRILHSAAEKTNDVEPDYACGWLNFNRSWGGDVLMHNGSNTMWYSVVWMSPRDGTIFMSVANRAGGKTELAVDQIFGTLIKLEAETRK